MIGGLRGVLREIRSAVRAAYRALAGDPNPTATPADMVELFPGLASQPGALTKP